MLWGLTFDMSGGAKGAKRPLGRPLDGGVRPHPGHTGTMSLREGEPDVWHDSERTFDAQRFQAQGDLLLEVTELAALFCSF